MEKPTFDSDECGDRIARRVISKQLGTADSGTCFCLISLFRAVRRDSLVSVVTEAEPRIWSTSNAWPSMVSRNSVDKAQCDKQTLLSGLARKHPRPAKSPSVGKRQRASSRNSIPGTRDRDARTLHPARLALFDSPGSCTVQGSQMHCYAPLRLSCCND